MDTTLRASRPVPADKISLEIKRILTAHNSELPARSRLTRAAIESRTNLILHAYKAAWTVGNEIHRPANLGQTLALKVLNHWRQRGLARATVAIRWAALRHFSVAIGKAGMLPPLEQIWPPEPEKEKGERVPLKVIERLSDEEYQILLARLKPKDPIYWIVRLEREIGMTHREALATNFVIGTERFPGMLIVSTESGQQSRVVPLTDPNQCQLVADVVAFVKRLGRETLCWPRKSMAAARQKVTDALSYQAQKLKESSIPERENHV